VTDENGQLTIQVPPGRNFIIDNNYTDWHITATFTGTQEYPIRKQTKAEYTFRT
jgi:hypothetical protein